MVAAKLTVKDKAEVPELAMEAEAEVLEFWKVGEVMEERKTKSIMYYVEPR